MINCVMFDMGGTLEDIWVDEASDTRALVRLQEMLASYGLPVDLPFDAWKRRIDDGWARYGAWRDATDIELKPVSIWCDYVLSDFGFDRAALEPHCETIAHMWEITHFHRHLRPGVAEMLEALRADGLRLGVISNTAALYQVFDTLEEYGIRGCFEDVTLSSVVGLRKPCRDIFTVSLRQMRARPEECAYVGDTLSRDIIGSKRSGFALAIQIGSKLTREKDARLKNAPKPDAWIDSIGEVPDVIRRANGR